MVRKREFVISLDLGTSTSTTRTTGDRLTLLYSHFTTSNYTHCCTIISLTTRSRMVAERNAVRFEKEQDSRKCMTGDAGERSSRMLGWDGEVHTYFSQARRAQQYVEGTKIQECYLCGPRLEAQLTGRAESAVEDMQARLAVPGAWRGNTAALPQDTLCQDCTPRHGLSLTGFFYKLKRKKYEPMASLYTIQKRMHQGKTSSGKTATY